MRLLNTSTLRVEEFQAQIPEYVILSHTWEEEEVTFQDVESGRAWKKKGYMKLVKCCERAASDGFTYCWLDTCCIDKTSSAELSEAINSMYQWYKHSRICYAYLADFESIAQSEKYGCRTFAQSRWWTRGWTLQELLAPAVVEFYDANWIEIGTKLSLHEQITEITGIDEGILRGTSLLQRNAAVRMSWAAGRETTRVEDRAYSLMGLFAVNMPLLYGEGERAFTRLQEEIMRAQEDYTLFAWSPQVGTGFSDPHVSGGLLANSPTDFVEPQNGWSARGLSKSTSMHSWKYRDLTMDCSWLLPPPEHHEPPSMTSRGLRICLPMLERRPGEFYACLTLVSSKAQEVVMLCIVLNRLGLSSERYIRRAGKALSFFSGKSSQRFEYRSIYVVQPPVHPEPSRLPDNPLATDTALYLLIAKRGYLRESIRCRFSSWISMQEVVESKFGAFASSYSMAQLETVPNVRGNLYRHSLNKLAAALSHHNPGELPNMAMGNRPDHCWFSDVNTSADYRTSGVRGVLGFSHDQYSNAAFLVQFLLFDDKAFCTAIPTTMDLVRHEQSQLLWTEEAQKSTLTRDRVSFRLHSRTLHDDSCLSAVEVTVSIRRVASTVDGIRRSVLSVTQKSVPSTAVPSSPPR